MSREVPKKIVDRGSVAPDHSEKELQLPGSLDSELDSGARGALPGLHENGDPRKTRSLDALEISDEEDSSLPLKGWDEEDLPAPSGPEEDSEQKPERRLSKILTRRKKILIALSILAVTTFMVTAYVFWPFEHKSDIPIVTQIRKPIPIPQYQEKIDFFLLPNAQSEKNLISLSIEFEFRSAGAHQKFKDEKVLFCDVVYRYLQNQRPNKNTQKEWGQIVQNDLLSHLKTTVPQSRADLIRISRFEKL